MTTHALNKSLAALHGNVVEVVANQIPDESGTASVIFCFQSGAALSASYWRLVDNRRTKLSSFDHGNLYGLPTPIDAKKALIASVNSRVCSGVTISPETGDVTICFGDSLTVQVFNFTAYEVWDISFPDGTVEYSNYALA